MVEEVSKAQRRGDSTQCHPSFALSTHSIMARCKCKLKWPEDPQVQWLVLYYSNSTRLVMMLLIFSSHIQFALHACLTLCNITEYGHALQSNSRLMTTDVYSGEGYITR